MERFNKKQLSLDILQRIKDIEKKWKFKSHLGWVQVTGKSEEVNRAYGEYECLLSLIDEYNLNA